MSTLPPFIYGTAWKEESTAECVEKAVHAGFRAIDTANQKKHYREDLVGTALLRLEAESRLKREELFLQSKYTYQRGQDHRLPYNPKDDVATQTRDSFASTLEHLHTDYLDSYLLHGPSSAMRLTDADWKVWDVFEELHAAGKARRIGISNVGLHHLEELCDKVKTRPHFVQNRCFAVHGWDQDVREFCARNNIVYQGFSLLTANQHVLWSPAVAKIARQHNATPEQIIFRFCIHLGILPITGTTNSEHMREDLSVLNLDLSETDIHAIAAASD